jgi:hypothetical protein
MELLVPNRARAYVYAGDWVSDCPRDGCGNVEHLFDRSNPKKPDSPRSVRKTQFYCTYCRMVAPIEWSDQEAEIMQVLERRPVPHNRNWYPSDHTTAIKFRIPHGQSVQDLRDENAEHGVA